MDPATSADDCPVIAARSYPSFTRIAESRIDVTAAEVQMDASSVSVIAPILPDQRHALRDKAEELEASFLAEMLAHSGLGEADGAFSGGAGETQFASFLRQEQARLIVEGGGLGLAELIFNSLVEAQDDPRA
jgi:Rod binding domain-containing protein